MTDKCSESVEQPDERDAVAIHDYCDAEGNLLFQILRYESEGPSVRRPDVEGSWIPNLDGTSLVLYRLPDIAKDSDGTVWIVRDEEEADNLAANGLIATTSPFGMGDWRDQYADTLKNRDVAIIPCDDESEREQANKVARSLYEVTRSLKGVLLPGAAEGSNLSDWLKDGHSVDELKELVAETPAWGEEEADYGEHAGETVDEQKESQADRLVNLVAASGAVLFHDDLETGFARVSVHDHREIWPCRSKKFKRWLSAQFWQMERKAPSSEAINSALNVLEAWAQFDGEEHALNNRVAWHEGAIWYDLADSGWRAVRVTAEGWEITNNPPILFRRYAHQQAQVEPEPGGGVRDLLGLLNVRDPSHEFLLLVYIVSCLVPDIPHPMPVLHGPQGSAKTTLFRILRQLVDPSAVPVLTFPRNATELVQQLSHHWAPFYDNIGKLPEWTSDMLCRAVTGEGFSKRELYTDDEDIVYRFRRCVALNGVNVVAHKPDLLDRSILFGLERIAASKRRPEDAIWREFEELRPRLLGAIFDTLSKAMAERSDVKLSTLPRMADFALWGCAIANALGRSQAEFLSAYEGNATARNEEALQANPVAALVVELIDERSEWKGTASELLAQLETLAEEHRVDIRASGWPKAAHTLSRHLNEVKPNLAAAGIEVRTDRSSRRRSLMIRKVDENAVTSVTSVTDRAESDGSVTPPLDGNAIAAS